MVTFAEYIEHILKDNLGKDGEEMFSKVMAKKSVDSHSPLEDKIDFIATVEQLVRILYGEEKAGEIKLLLQTQIKDDIEKKEQKDQEKIQQYNDEIEQFLHEQSLPTETDIADFAESVAVNYGEDYDEVIKDITHRIKIHVRESINQSRIKDEIELFITKYPDATQDDIDDFIHYLKLLKLSFDRNTLVKKIEKLRLFRKFQAPQEEEEESMEFEQFIDIIKSNKDQKSISKVLEEQELSYIIKDGSGKPDGTLSELIEFLTPNE